MTGRKRRCGWFDAVMVRQAMKVGGIDGIALTKLDVLDGLDALKVCTAYREAGETLDHLPAAAIKYIRRVEELIETPVALLSTSPERTDTVLVRAPFAD